MGKQLNIPIFDVFVDEDGLGLFGISYVDRPAIIEELVAFRSDKQYVYLASNEKHEIVSPLAIPDQLIYRATEEGIPYYMRLSADTIKLMAQKFLASGNWNQWTFMHENIDDDMKDRIQDGIYMKRMWIIDDEKTDDANTKYGFNLPKGTLMVHAKVQNRSIWSKIKSGEIRGLSLEAFFKLKSSNKALQINYRDIMNKLDFNEKTMNLFSKFIAFLNEVSQEADGVASEAVKDNTESGIVELKYYIDDDHYFTVDGEGIVRDENLNPVEEGEYKLADGSIFVVGSGSNFVETKANEGEINDETVEAPIAETFEEEKKEEDEKDDDKPQDEGEPIASEPSDEEPKDGDEKNDGDGSEEDPKKDEDKLEDEEPKEDEEDKKEEAPMVNAFPFEIEGVEYLLPEAVINYIQSLQTSKIEVEEKLTQMAEQTPSAQPIGTVVKNSEEVSDINSQISALSMFKGFRSRN